MQIDDCSIPFRSASCIKAFYFFFATHKGRVCFCTFAMMNQMHYSIGLLMVTTVPIMSVWVTNLCSVFHFCSRLHMIAFLRQLLHGQASLTFFFFWVVWHAIWVFQLHVSVKSIVNSFNNAVRPTKQVCLNLEFFPQQFHFESGWKELK